MIVLTLLLVEDLNVKHTLCPAAQYVTHDNVPTEKGEHGSKTQTMNLASSFVHKLTLKTKHRLYSNIVSRIPDKSQAKPVSTMVPSILFFRKHSNKICSEPVLCTIHPAGVRSIQVSTIFPSTQYIQVPVLRNRYKRDICQKGISSVQFSFPQSSISSVLTLLLNNLFDTWINSYLYNVVTQKPWIDTFQ